MSIEKVKEYLAKFSAEDKILEFSVSSATVELAAKALGCEPCQIAKSMAFVVGENAILVVAAGDVKIDNAKFKAEFKTKAKMVQFNDVEAAVGHAAGGVCPFAVNDGVEIYLDESLKRFEKIYPAAGSSNSAIPLSIAELEEYSAFNKWVDVCKFMQ